MTSRSTESGPPLQRDVHKEIYYIHSPLNLLRRNSTIVFSDTENLKLTHRYSAFRGDVHTLYAAWEFILCLYIIRFVFVLCSISLELCMGNFACIKLPYNCNFN